MIRAEVSGHQDCADEFSFIELFLDSIQSPFNLMLSIFCTEYSFTHSSFYWNAMLPYSPTTFSKILEPIKGEFEMIAYIPKYLTSSVVVLCCMWIASLA